LQITISAEELQLRCDELIDQVAAGGLTVVITKDGQPIAMLIPIPAEVEPVDNLQVISEDAKD
jgi:prevent-host-death family protein